MFFVTPYNNLQQSSSREMLKKAVNKNHTNTKKSVVSKSILNYNNKETKSKYERQIKPIKYTRDTIRIQEKRHLFNHYQQMKSSSFIVSLTQIFILLKKF